jgi:hypothetical protein
MPAITATLADYLLITATETPQIDGAASWIAVASSIRSRSKGVANAASCRAAHRHQCRVDSEDALSVSGAKITRTPITPAEIRASVDRHAREKAICRCALTISATG